MNKKLHVIAVLSNPLYYRSRYDLFDRFAEEMNHSNAEMHYVELAFGERQFHIPDSPQNTSVRVFSYDEMWHKENLINIGLARLPSDWEYVAWIDADISFYTKKWVAKTLHALQHYMVVQPFESAVDLGPTGNVLNVRTSFCAQYLKNGPDKYRPGYGLDYFTGFAWAARREAIEGLGGLIDKCIIGSGDHHMAWAMVGQAHKSIPNGISPGYRRMVMDWEARAERFVRRDIGFVPGTILHNWHGKKRDRKYWDRWKVLLDTQFDPFTDIKRDTQGIFQLNDDGSDRMMRLRDGLRSYFRARNEDSIDLE